MKQKNKKIRAQIFFGVEHKYFYFNIIGDVGIRGQSDLRWIRLFIDYFFGVIEVKIQYTHYRTNPCLSVTLVKFSERIRRLGPRFPTL